MKILMAAVGLLPNLDLEDPLGLGYIASHLKEYAEVSFAGFLSPEAFPNKLVQESPDRLFLSSFQGADNPTMRIIEDSFQLGVPVVLGGAGFTNPVFPQAHSHPGVESIVFGEADALSPNVLLGSAEDVRGIWRHGGKLPKLPAVLTDPDAALFPLRPNLISGRTKSARLLTSRGCPLDCDFCPLTVVKHISKNGWRPRGLTSIAFELAEIIKLGAQNVSVADDCATPISGGCSRLDDLASVFAGSGVEFSVMVSPLALVGLTNRQANTWFNAGIRKIFLILNEQSGLERGHLNPMVFRVISQLRESGIEIEVGCITIDPFMNMDIFLYRLRSIAMIKPMSYESYIRPIVLINGTPIEQRYRANSRFFQAGEMAKKRGINFGFVDERSVSLVEKFLSFIETVSFLKSEALSQEVIQWTYNI